MMRNWKNGRRWIRKIDLLTSSLKLFRKWGIFLSTIISSNKDSKDVWICISAPESRRKNLISTLNHSSLNFQMHPLSDPFLPHSTSPTQVTQVQLSACRSAQKGHTWPAEMNQAWLSCGRLRPANLYGRKNMISLFLALIGQFPI